MIHFVDEYIPVFNQCSDCCSQLSRHFKVIFQMKTTFLEPFNLLRRVIKLKTRKISSALFSADWYLNQYPDVAKSSMSPIGHFRNYGYAEGRLPSELASTLWAGSEQTALEKLSHFSTKPDFNGDIVRWVLARWFASRDEWQKVMDCYPVANLLDYHHFSLGQRLLLIDALTKLSRIEDAEQVLTMCVNDCPEWRHDFFLANANLIKSLSGTHHHSWSSCVNQLFSKYNLSRIKNASSLDDLNCESVTLEDQPEMVSVVIPVRNGAAWITTSIRALMSQTWTNLEVIIVDDASTDDTLEVVKSFAAKYSFIKFICMREPSGTYAARNAGVSIAKGDFITVHDADDWSHCEKIALQVDALQNNPDTVASISYWVRATTDLVFGGWQTPENWCGWIHKNVSSLMVRRRVIDELGYWDAVRCSADTEYYYRLIQAYGAKSIVEVLPGVPLSIGRSHPQSLTQLKETNVFTIFGGVRKTYHQAFTRWHEAAKSRHDLYMPQYPTKRLFPAPAEICLATIEQE